MKKKLLMGNAAAAYGALEAGVNLVCGYPGTPSSELLETVAHNVKQAVAEGRISAAEAPHVEWSVNEKAALEVAFGASISGARALVTMKQVGLNVAADPLLTIAYLGVKGGLVLYVADDPGPISSQNEQDTRQFAQFAKVPLLDASSPEELHAMTREAFDLSERHAVPVIVRATTRVCHGSAPVPVTDTYRAHEIDGFVKDPHWVIFPPLAYQAHSTMPKRFAAVVADPSFSDFSFVQAAHHEPCTTGIVASGISWAYLLDALQQLELEQPVDLMKVGAPFPFDDDKAAEFLEKHERILVFEELEATIERELLRIVGSRHLSTQVCGKLTQSTRFAGENSVESISADLLAFMQETRDTPPLSPSYENLQLARPPVLCAGCPHRASFYAVKKALRGKKASYSGDIGCYTLGNALPLSMTDTCVCMGAGFTVPQGMYWAEPTLPHIGFVGDSTFFASGLTGVVNAVYNQAQVTLIVLDNSLTAMTGSQPNPGTGIRMSFDADKRDAHNALLIPQVLEALGIKHVKVVNPLELDEAVQAVKEAVLVPGVSALVFKAPCINISQRKAPVDVDAKACTGCRVCIESIGCPALVMDESENIIRIDEELCNGCALCTFVCPYSALVRHE